MDIEQFSIQYINFQKDKIWLNTSIIMNVRGESTIVYLLRKCLFDLKFVGLAWGELLRKNELRSNKFGRNAVVQLEFSNKQAQKLQNQLA